MTLSVEAADRNAILAPGDMLGCYRIQGFLGRGGFGVTYLALDTKLDLQVAIKEYLPEQIAERTNNNAVQPRSSDKSTFSWGLSRFIKEAQTLAKFKHTSIVRVMAVFEQNGTAYMIMEYERGHELKELIQNRHISREADLKKIIGPIIDGLAEVHRHGYIHRDIKPANILIRRDGSPVLLDFGSARLATGAQTQSLTALVSVGYAPLEQYNDTNASQQGPWTDIYALGAVLYYAITGNVPVDSTLRGSAVVNDQQDPLTPLEAVAPDDISVPFCRAIDWALSFRILDRPQSMEQWRSKLLPEFQASADETVLMPRVSTRALERHLVSPDHETARNQVIDTYSALPDIPTDRRKLTVDHASVAAQASLTAEGHSQVTDDALDSPYEWETQRDREQRLQTMHSSRDKKRGASKIQNNRTPVIIGLCFVALSLLAFSERNRWLPLIQTPDEQNTSAQSGESQIAAENLSIEQTQAEAQRLRSEQIAEEASRKRVEEERFAAAKAAEEAAGKLAEERRIAAARAAEEAARKFAEEQRIAAAKAAEEAARKLAEEQRIAAAKATEEEARKLAEEQRIAAAKAAEEAARKLAEEQRIAAAKAAEEAARKLAEEQRIAAAKAAAEASNKRAEAARIAAAKAAEDALKKRAEEERIATAKAAKEATEKAAADRQETQLSLDAARPITDTDIGNVLQQFDSLRRAIIRKDETALTTLTYPSERKNAYLKYLFRTFESIKVSLGGVRTSPGDQTVRANLQIVSMRRSNGDVVFPPSEFKTIPIHSKRSGEWSKIHW
ncbi:MAG: serine/threonine-protein kinase [Granulosicoccus sp.]